MKAEGDSEAVSDTNSYGGGIRSTNAPSLGASIKGSMFDVANLDTTHSPIPEEDMSQGEENQCKKKISFFGPCLNFCTQVCNFPRNRTITCILTL